MLFYSILAAAITHQYSISIFIVIYYISILGAHRIITLTSTLIAERTSGSDRLVVTCLMSASSWATRLWYLDI